MATGVADSSARSAVPTHTIAITLHGRQPSGQARRVSVPLGTVVSLAVTSDAADEIHVHGYDRKAEDPARGHGIGELYGQPSWCF